MNIWNPVTWFTNIPPEWAVFFLSMIPVTELRASIPIGIEVYGLPIWQVWIIAVLGDLIPAIVLLLAIPKIYNWLLHRPFVGKLFAHKVERARAKFGNKYAKYGAIALITFVGIPLPMTGSWTGSLVAFLFGIPFRKSIIFITCGVCLAATLVTLITLFAGGTIRWLISL